MMRLLRALIVLVFLLGCGAGGYTKYRSLQTIENSAPVITMAEDTLYVTCDAGREALLEGVKAEDKEDGDLTDEIVIENASNFIEPGRCRIYYAVFDKAGKVATASRYLVYTDYEAPKIELNEALEFTQGSNVNVLDKITAFDKIDGDVTKNVEIMNSTVKSSVSGNYRVKVQVSNSHGDAVKIELPVIITDPKDQNLVLKLDTPLLRLEQGKEFSAKSHLKSVKDASGNDVTLYWKKDDKNNANVNVSGSVNTEAPGVYYVTYTVINSSGNRGTAILTVVVEGQEETEE